MSGTIGDNVYRASGVVAAAAAAGISWQSVETGATFTAVAGNGYPVNTTAQACTVTLPASASVGDEIIFTDYARNWGTNALTIDQNSLNYQGETSPNPEYDTAGESIHIVYQDATKGWIPLFDGAVADEVPQSNSIEYLCVAGGAGGGFGHYGGGGGAGGFLTATQNYTQGSTIVVTVVVGAGGAGATSGGAKGTNGGLSSIASSAFSTVTSVGGGGAGSRSTGAGVTGGSGGGASIGTNSGGAATAGQGYAGGDCASDQYGAGGGGASEVGAPGVSGSAGGGLGGDGIQSTILVDATDVYYGGGGGGGTHDADGATVAGGDGGGGNGGYDGPVAPVAGTDGLGGGGGGANNPAAGADGGNGIVIFRILTADYSGTSTNTEAITTDGSYTILKWLVDGTYDTE